MGIFQKAKEKFIETIETASGKKMTEENIEYYEKVTQVLLGMDSEFNSFSKKIEIVDKKINEFKSNLESEVESIKQNMLDMHQQLERTQEIVNNNNRYLEETKSQFTNNIVDLNKYLNVLGESQKQSILKLNSRMDNIPKIEIVKVVGIATLISIITSFILFLLL